MKKSFGIIGSGNIGQAVAKHLVKAGYPVIMSNSRGPESVRDVVKSLGEGAKAGSVRDAVKADVVLLSLPWTQASSLTKAADWKNKLVIDATNHFIRHAPDYQLADLHGKASSQIVAEHLPGASVVKAFNTLNFKILGQDPNQSGGRRVLFISGDDAPSKSVVAEVIKELGFAVVDLGDLANGSEFQQAKGPLATLNLIQL
ncbi:NADPH-dependent F420 reductase [Chryseolinea soli]|uniref:NADP oxidoreductase n=1 Tax=Chryseolinea soli TaxID=2321403 RepID=A0A385SSR7_9BACT|nr:NADPH-dependent F420 reductase [Chryseolinea soli]AYB34863.1 NADP oxidoreductase [Chryseolinea soli]